MNQRPVGDASQSSFGPLLHRLRLAEGWTQEALAERAGISVEAVSALERGARRSPRRDTVERLAVALALDGEDRSRFLAAAVSGRVRLDARPDPGGSPATVMLPNDPTPFIGRERERTDVLRLLDESRLLTLTGPAGVGKTRLATAVAAEAAELFPDGVYFVPLAGVSDPRHVPAAIADALGITSSAAGSVEARLDDFLGQKRVLMLLDNFEQLSAGAPVIAGILERHPHVTLFVTSRTRLHIRSERQYSVPPMSVPDMQGDPTMEELLCHDATALF